MITVKEASVCVYCIAASVKNVHELRFSRKIISQKNNGVVPRHKGLGRKHAHVHSEYIFVPVVTYSVSANSTTKYTLYMVDQCTYVLGLIPMHRNAVLTEINTHPVVIVSGSTGSGKSTQVRVYKNLDAHLPLLSLPPYLLSP